MANSSPTIAFFTFLDQDHAYLITQYSPPGYEILIHPIKTPDKDKIRILEASDFLLLFPSQISTDALYGARHLRLIQLLSAGYDHLDLDFCRELGIPVANNGGANAIDVAEHTVALILASFRRLIQHSKRAKEGDWSLDLATTSCHTIHGKTVGVIGMGNIGKQVARLLSNFAAEILYYDQIRVNAEIERGLEIIRKDFESLIRESDVLTLHVPLTKDTYHMIDEHEFALMKRNALVVNTSRGEVINEAALIDALEADLIAGAALDVLEEEPPRPSKSRIAELENVILTPHIAGITVDTWERRAQFAFQNIKRVWEGKPPLAQVN